MKSLNQRAVRVLESLLQSNQPVTTQINGSPREVEAKISHDIGRYRIITLTFYYEEEGFRMREPEIVIFHDTQTSEYIVASILYDNERIISNSVNLVYGTLKIWNDKIISDNTEIANNFLESIPAL